MAITTYLSMTMSSLVMTLISMSIPDEAEIWWPSTSRKQKPFTHILGATCGRFQLPSMPVPIWLGNIDCPACLKLIEEGYDHKLPETFPLSAMSKSARKKERKRLKWACEQEELYGRCSCGSLYILRVNSKTKKEFLGCSKYPKCKNTKSIN